MTQEAEHVNLTGIAGVSIGTSQDIISLGLAVLVITVTTLTTDDTGVIPGGQVVTRIGSLTGQPGDNVESALGRIKF